jgi:hypothetical protein
MKTRNLFAEVETKARRLIFRERYRSFQYERVCLECMVLWFCVHTDSVVGIATDYWLDD